MADVRGVWRRTLVAIGVGASAAVWSGCAASPADGAGSSGAGSSGAGSSGAGSSGAGSPGAIAGPEGAEVEATSLLGLPLVRAQFSAEREATLTEDLAAAEAALAAAPTDEDAWIWYGRRLAYLGRYRDAIAAYTEALALHPESHRLHRHRGHRWISVRDFERGESDLARAAELAAGRPDVVEPDGAPNPYGIPTGTDKSNIYYHLGLARYLQGDFDAALDAYRECLLVARSIDTKVATTYWTYLTLMQLGRAEEARALLAGITPDMQLLENHAYHALLLHFAGTWSEEQVLDGVEPDSVDHATRSYGLACAQLFRGETSAAAERLANIVSHEAWAAFGHIAAEAEMARRDIRRSGD